MPSITVEVKQVDGTSTSEGIARTHHVLIDRPTDKGGLDRGPLGGEMLLLALGGCFMSNLIAALKARDLKVSGLKILVSGELASAPARFEVAVMQIHGHCQDENAFEHAIQVAERSCIVTNTLKAGMQIKVERVSS